MRSIRYLIFVFILSGTLYAQQNRVSFNGQDLWLNGGNVAWVNFARDVGPGTFPESDFQAMFDQVRENGANSMRLWIHTTGESTPEWNGNEIVSPGQGTIEDLEKILVMAEDSGIGIILCLWSFDMMRTSNGSTIVNRSKALLESAELTQTYIDNALTPMVEALADYPALLAWEIFNEPEGMSNEFGWDHTTHTAMENIQRFTNQTAGAIHRAAPEELVSNGSWSFHSLATTTNSNSKNYYSDDELIAAGGDSLGTLDFYMVHYYSWGRTELSPFHNTKASWGLNKPVVVGEFGIPAVELYGIPSDSLYQRLYDNGYAGALVWQWVDWYQNRGDYGDDWLRGLDQMKAMQNAYPNEIDIIFDNPRIRMFDASFDEIESGGQTELKWEVQNATNVTLNGNPVNSRDTLVVSPTEDTLYELIAFGQEAENDTARVQIRVLPAGLINRAGGKPSRSSTFESCCGVNRTPDRAFDGDDQTRWSSAWSTGTGDDPDDQNTDDDPDNEWIDVDLEQAVDITSVLLDWEAAYATRYELQTSLDGVNWKTVHEELSGDGGKDSVVFSSPEFGRFVRMQAFERATRFGHSLWEFEVRGAVSVLQPPVVAINSPSDGKGVEIGKSVTVTASATDSDGSIEAVYFFLNGDSLGADETAPFSFIFPEITAGEQTIYVKAIDNDGLLVQSESITVEGRDDIISLRLEAEQATLTGATSVETGLSGASLGNAVYMEGSGSITWEDLDLLTGDRIDITVRYWLPFDYKEQILTINGETVDTLIFDVPVETWQDITISKPFNEPVQSISIDHYWGYMTFDYIDLSIEGITVSNETVSDDPSEFTLDQNYPNPFNPTTTIRYSLPVASAVTLDVYGVNGQKVAELVDTYQASGEYTVNWNAGSAASGIYFVRMEAGNTVQIQKMTLIK